MMITYVYCELEVSKNTLKFSNGPKTAITQLEVEKITLIYEKTQVREPLDAILSFLMLHRYLFSYRIGNTCLGFHSFIDCKYIF